MPDSPYKYLDYYDVGDKDIFFGREPEIVTLLADIVVSRLVVLFAKTGTGKTSLINAGVRPRLEERDYKTFIVQVRQDPVASLRRELGLPGQARESLAEELEHLSAEVYQKPLVLFFDQFEEFFTYVRADSPEGLKFISDIADINENQESGLHVVFSMREEWFSELDAFRDKIPTIFHNESNLRLRWFDESQAREAIKHPAQTFGVTIDDGLVDRLIADLSDNGMIEPAQLQIICDALWREREDGRITLSHYQKSGWREGEPNIARQILYRRLGDEFEKIETEKQLRLLNRLLPQLRTPPPRSIKYVRDIVGLAKELETDEESLLDLTRRLESSRLIRTGVRDALPVIELLHDYLVEYLDKLAIRIRAVWPRRLLRAGLEAYRRNGTLLPDDDVASITEYVKDEDVKRLTLGREEAELLFRSSLEYGLDMHGWFNLAAKYDVRTWDILREEIQAGGGAGVSDHLIYLLAQLLSDEPQAPAALELLLEALGQKSLAETVVKSLERHETVPAVDLLQAALGYDYASSHAREVLKRFAASKRNDDVASLARTALRTLTVEGETESRDEGRDRILDKESISESPDLYSPPPKTHFTVVSRALLERRMIVLLGSGINLADRSPGVNWAIGKSLPGALELATYLAERFSCPPELGLELPRVAQHAKLMYGLGPLYETLNDILDADYAPNPVHKFCASLPAIMRENGSLPGPNPLRRRLILITTNFDNVLEVAFEMAGEPYHVLTYIAAAADYEVAGRFLHRSPDGLLVVIHDGREYIGIADDAHPVIIKICGSVNRYSVNRYGDSGTSYSSFVISEDDHLQFYRRADLSRALPSEISASVKNCGFLVLGQRMSGWHERALMDSLWGQRLSYRSWVVNLNATSLETLWLARQGVDVINTNLEEYVHKLATHIESAADGG